MQSRGLKLNPITTLYYIAPASFGFLAILWLYMEAEAVLHHPIVSCCTTPLPIHSLFWKGDQMHQWLAMHMMVLCKQRSSIAELWAHHSISGSFLVRRASSSVKVSHEKGLGYSAMLLL